MSSSDKWEKQVKPCSEPTPISLCACGEGCPIPNIFPMLCQGALPLSPVQVLSTKEAWQKWAEPTPPSALLTPVSGHISPWPKYQMSCRAASTSQSHQAPSCQEPHPTHSWHPRNPTGTFPDGASFNPVLRGVKWHLVFSKLHWANTGACHTFPWAHMEKGRDGELTADWLVTHQDRDGSQLTSENKQGESKSHGGAERLSLNGLAAHRILEHSYLLPVPELSWYSCALWSFLRAEGAWKRSVTEANTMGRGVECCWSTKNQGIKPSDLREYSHFTGNTNAVIISKYRNKHLKALTERLSNLWAST